MYSVRQLTAETIAQYTTCCVLCLVACSVGCSRNPYTGTPTWGAPLAMNPYGTVNPYGVAPGTPTVGGAVSPYVQPQLAELERRVQQLDVNNRQLTTQLAQSQQQVQLLRDRESLMQKQLQDTTINLQQERLAKQELQGQTRGMQASMALRGGATLRPNTSALGSQALGVAAQPYPSSSIPMALQIPGAVVQSEGSVVRIRVPSDQLFAQNTGQLNPNAYQLLDNVATAILKNHPRQRVAVEAHTDSSAVGGAFATPYQLATSQAQAVVDQLIRRNTLPPQQLTVVAHGPNFPRGDNQTPAGRAENRRMEFVIYPETF